LKFQETKPELKNRRLDKRVEKTYLKRNKRIRHTLSDDSMLNGQLSNEEGDNK
jgi:hypothetical protein